jgi:hypothetical protein
MLYFIIIMISFYFITNLSTIFNNGLQFFDLYLYFSLKQKVKNLLQLLSDFIEEK